MSTYIVTGVQGQDGFILTEQLLSQGHQVIGVGRRRLDDFSLRDRRLIHFASQASYNFRFEICDLRDATRTFQLISSHQPDFVVNLAALSSPSDSWSNTSGTFMNDTLAVVNLLDAIKIASPHTHLIQACTAAIYKSSLVPISEESAVEPSSPYASAKLSAKSVVEIYRNRYDLRVSNVIMFNHESEWRPDAFVTRKITKTIAEIEAGKKKLLELWTLSPIRDWGWAEEFMTAIMRICELGITEDLVLATGEGASIQQFLETVLSLTNLRFEEHVKITNANLVTGSDISIGNPKKAESLLGWKPSILWQEIAERMFIHDRQLVKEPLAKLW